MGQTALRTEDLARSFGGLRALDGVDLAVRKGSIHGLVGPNGAGKTTLFNLVAGLHPVSRGRIHVDGQDVTGLSPEARVKAGLCRTFQTPQLFEDMTVRDTVMTGHHLGGKVGIMGSMFSFGPKRREEAALRAAADRQIAAVGLTTQADTLARNLSYGQRRLLEIARALATNPSVLLLDEVTSGLNPSETDEVAALVRRIVGQGVTIVLIEHDMRFVMGLSERVTVLNFGRKLAEGTPEEVSRNEDVVMAYLGSRNRMQDQVKNG